MGLGQRFTHSTASCRDFTCHNQYPATSSLVSVNGPSITVRFAPENRTRFPSLVAFTMTITRIWCPLPVGRLLRRLTRTTNDARQDRHHATIFFELPDVAFF